MKRRILASGLAFTALASATSAQAQSACVFPKDLRDGLTYAMPIAYDATVQKCNKRFKVDGFMLTKGVDFANRFRVKQDDAWPGTFRLLRVFLEKGDGPEGKSENRLDGIGAMMATLPESAIRPFVDALMAQMIAEEIKPETCSKIERAARLIEPLPVENIAELLTFIAEQSDLKNPSLCAIPAIDVPKAEGTSE